MEPLRWRTCRRTEGVPMMDKLIARSLPAQAPGLAAMVAVATLWLAACAVPVGPVKTGVGAPVTPPAPVGAPGRRAGPRGGAGARAPPPALGAARARRPERRRAPVPVRPAAEIAAAPPAA